jgi:hypothetical protein
MYPNLSSTCRNLSNTSEFFAEGNGLVVVKKSVQPLESRDHFGPARLRGNSPPPLLMTPLLIALSNVMKRAFIKSTVSDETSQVQSYAIDFVQSYIINFLLLSSIRVYSLGVEFELPMFPSTLMLVVRVRVSVDAM